jgi:D-alanyl-D-alanine carboxypeptidase
MLKRWQRFWVVSLHAVLVFGLTLPGTQALAAGPARPGSDNVRLQMLLDELVTQGASGALARVDAGNRTWLLASGAARLQPRQTLTPTARFRVGSVTKTFVSTVALQLVGDGTLRLDDTVERWVPGLVPAGSTITLRMLLNHTSGLFNYTDDEAFVDRHLRDPTRPVTPRELVAVATAHPPTFPPGAGWSYSNTGYIVVGLMIEAATGQPVERLVQQRIVRVLGLSGTSFPTTDPDIAGYHAHGYRLPAAPGQPYLDVTLFAPSLAWTAGAIVSTATDLRRFYGALLGGRLLRPAMLDQMLTTVAVSPTYGYGLGIYSLRGPCGTTWGHDGGIPGYLTSVMNDRGGKRGAVVEMPTEPDPALGDLLRLTVDTATCQALGAVPPTATPVESSRSSTTRLS